MVYVCMSVMSVDARREQMVLDPPWTWSGFRGLNSSPLEDQQVPLTTELSLSLTLLVSMLVWPSLSLSPVLIKSRLILWVGVSSCFRVSRISHWVQILRHLKASNA